MGERCETHRFAAAKKAMGVARRLGKNAWQLKKARPQMYADKRESFKNSFRLPHLRTSSTSADKILLQLQRAVSPLEAN
jgi:hypothetical protein